MRGRRRRQGRWGLRDRHVDLAGAVDGDDRNGLLVALGDRVGGGRAASQHRVRGVHQLRRGREALVARLRHRARDDPVELLGQILAHLRQLRRRARQVGMHDRDLCLPLERRPAGEALVEHATKRIDVCATVERQPLDLLGRGVLDGADEDAGAREVRRARLLRDPEVRQVHVLRELGDQDVRGLHVAVDQVVVVGSIQCARDLLEHVERAPDAQAPVPPKERAQVGPVDVPHRDVEQTVGVAAVDLACVVDRDDVRVVEPRRALRLSHEPLPEARVVRQRRRQHLEGHLAAEAHVLGEIDDAHAAAAEQGLHPVPGQHRADARSLAHAHVATAPERNRLPAPACRIRKCPSRLGCMLGREGSFRTCLTRGRCA